MKNSKDKSEPLSEQDLTKIEGLLEKYKLESKVEDDNQEFLTESFFDYVEYWAKSE